MVLPCDPLIQRLKRQQLQQHQHQRIKRWMRRMRIRLTRTTACFPFRVPLHIGERWTPTPPPLTNCKSTAKSRRRTGNVHQLKTKRWKRRRNNRNSKTSSSIDTSASTTSVEFVVIAAESEAEAERTKEENRRSTPVLGLPVDAASGLQSLPSEFKRKRLRARTGRRKPFVR